MFRKVFYSEKNNYLEIRLGEESLGSFTVSVPINRYMYLFRAYISICWPKNSMINLCFYHIVFLFFFFFFLKPLQLFSFHYKLLSQSMGFQQIWLDHKISPKGLNFVSIIGKQVCTLVMAKCNIHLEEYTYFKCSTQ